MSRIHRVFSSKSSQWVDWLDPCQTPILAGAPNTRRSTQTPILATCERAPSVSELSPSLRWFCQRHLPVGLIPVSCKSVLISFIGADSWIFINSVDIVVTFQTVWWRFGLSWIFCSKIIFSEIPIKIEDYSVQFKLDAWKLIGKSSMSKYKMTGLRFSNIFEWKL